MRYISYDTIVTDSVTGEQITFDTLAQAQYFVASGEVLEAAEAARKVKAMATKQQYIQEFATSLDQMYGLQKKLLLGIDTQTKKSIVFEETDFTGLGFTMAEFLAMQATLFTVLTGVSDTDSAKLYKCVPLKV